MANDMLTSFGRPRRFYNLMSADLPGTRFPASGITPGSSVLGIRFDGGILVSADTLVTYGNLARYQNVDRVIKISDSVLLGGGGDFADIQSIVRTIDQKIINDHCRDDGASMKPMALVNWLTRLLYGRRSLKQPLKAEIIVAGIEDGCRPYLSAVDARGSPFENYVAASGFARLIAVPLVRERKPIDRDFSLKEASTLIRDCMRILYYRDTRSIAQYTVGICTPDNCSIKGPFKAEENWAIADHVSGY